MRKYCGFIATFINNWIREGHKPPAFHSTLIRGFRLTQNDAVSITSGGTLLDTTTQTGLYFDSILPTTAGSLNRQSLDIAIPYKGLIAIWAGGWIKGGGAGPTVVDLYIKQDGSQINATRLRVVVPASTDEGAGFEMFHRFSVDTLNGAYIPRINITAAKVVSGDPNVTIQNYWATLMTIPSTDVAPIPLVN